MIVLRRFGRVRYSILWVDCWRWWRRLGLRLIWWPLM